MVVAGSERIASIAAGEVAPPGSGFTTWIAALRPLARDAVPRASSRVEETYVTAMSAPS